MAGLVVEIHVPLVPVPDPRSDYPYSWIDDVEVYLAGLDGSDGQEYDSGEELGGEYLFFVSGAPEAQLIELAMTVAQLPGVPAGVYVTVNDTEGDMGDGRRVDLPLDRSQGIELSLVRSRDGGRPALLPGAEHPRFAAHFTDALYRDQSDRFAPFGSAEGADILAETEANPLALEQGTLARLLIDIGHAQKEMSKPASKRSEKTYAIVISYGFALLRLAGQIDAEGKDLLTAALTRRLELHQKPPPQLVTMLTELAGFPASPRRRPRLP